MPELVRQEDPITMRRRHMPPNNDVEEYEVLEPYQKATSRQTKWHKSNMHTKIRAAKQVSPEVRRQSMPMRSRPIRSSASSVHEIPRNEQQEYEQLVPQEMKPSGNAFKHLELHAASATDSSAYETGQIDLSRVRKQILSVGFDCPDLCRRLGETAEDAVIRVLEQYRKLNVQASQVQSPTSANREKDPRPIPQGWWDCKERLVAREQGISELEAELNDRNNKHEQEVIQLTTTVKRLQQELMLKDSRMIEEAMKHKHRLASLKQEGQKESDALWAQIALLQYQNKEMEMGHAARSRKENRRLVIEQESHQRLLEELQQKASGRIEEQQKLHGESVLSLQDSLDKLQQQLGAERSKREACMADLEAAKALVKQRDIHAKYQFDKQAAFYTEVIYKERASFEQRMTDYQVELRQQKEELREAQKTDEERFVDERRRLDIELQKQKMSLAEKHEEEKWALRNIIEDFKHASATRDKSKGLTNAELVARFSKLTQEVEDFARVDWDPTREAQWWTQQLKQLNPRNTRKLKQKLIQNSLWISLHEQVFRSPFKLFAGEQEWKDLDKNWIEIYAFSTSSSQWPAIPLEVEKARHENAKHLRAAIVPAAKTGTTDRLEQLKIMYEQAVTSAVTNVGEKIERVATLKEKDRVALHNIVRLSAGLWLECCSQRSRILVTLASGVEDVLGVTQGNIRLVKVVLKPAVRKFGNAHGDNLTVEEPIIGWRQEVEVYPPQRVVSG